MSHSSDSAPGGYFFVAQRDNSKVSLHKIQLSENNPQSVAELGQYVISAEDDEIRVFDMRNSGSSQSIRYRIKGLEAGGGLAMTKMADGTYLLWKLQVETAPSIITFYRINGSLTNTTTVRAIELSPPIFWYGARGQKRQNGVLLS